MNWVNEEDERKTALHQSVLGVGLTVSVDLVFCYAEYLQFLCGRVMMA